MSLPGKKNSENRGQKNQKMEKNEGRTRKIE